jgi:CheY-like chemotaxis protein
MAEALRALDAQPVDLLISDIGLPDADGYALMREVRAKFGIKGICMTGYGMDDDIRKSREAGFINHIVKPVDAQQLREVVAQVMR